MKTLSNIIILTFLLALVSFQVQAQGGPGMRNMDPEEIAQLQTDQMKEQMELSEEAWSQVEDINLAYVKKTQAVFEKHGRNRDAIRPELESLNKEKNAELKEILSKEQMKVYRDIQKANREEMRKRREERPEGGRP